MANPQITTTPVSTAFSTTNTSTATTSATNWSAQSLTGPAVSSTNALSDGMNTTNIVQSNLTRTIPYSNYSVNFDAASSDYIDCGQNTNLDTGDLSASIWINKDSTGSGIQYIFNNNNGSSIAGFSILMNGINSVYLYRNTGTYSAATGYTNVSFTTDTWHHLCFTYNDTTKSFVAYFNGVSFHTSTATSSSGGASQNIIIGTNSGLSGLNFDGKLSNASIWNAALTEDDIINLYNNGITQDLNNFRITPTAWYPLDQSYTYFNGSVLVARDTIGGRDGTGVNLVQSDIHGTAPGSEASGTGVNLTIADLKGNMYNSDKNAYSINMADYADGVTNPANSGRSTDTPS